MLAALTRLTLFLVGTTLLLDQLEAYEAGNFLVSPNKALTMVLLVLACVQLLLSGGRLPRNSKTLWILVFYLSLALSSIYAAGHGSAWSFLLGRWGTFLAMFFFYFLMCFVIRTRRDLDLFYVALLVSAVIASVSAYLSEGLGGYWNPVRKSGVGSGTNQAAGNILAVLPFAYVLAVSTRSLFVKVFMLATSATLVFGYVVALSRSAFLAVLAMGGLFSLRFRRMPDPRLIAAIAMLGAIAVFAAPEGYTDRLKTLLIFAEDTRSPARSTRKVEGIHSRMEIYKAGLVGFATHPIIGVGTDRYLDWVASYSPRLASGHTIHNAVISVACQQGLLGLIPYLAILILTFLDFSRAQRLALSRRDLDDPELKALYLRAVMTQIGYVGILIVAQFQPGTFWRGMWVMFAFSTIILSFTRDRLAQLAAEVPAPVPTGADDSRTPSFQPRFGAYSRPR